MNRKGVDKQEEELFIFWVGCGSEFEFDEGRDRREVVERLSMQLLKRSERERGERGEGRIVC